MYRALIFDLDGTLLNTLEDLANAGNHTLQVLRFAPHLTEEYKQMVGNGIPKLVERFLPPQARGAATQALALQLFTTYYSAHKQDKTAPYAGITSLLRSLREKNILLGVVSNKEDTLANAVIAHYFPHVFDAVAGQISGTAPKPNPARVYEIADKFGIAPREILYAGDSDVDIFTAKNAGMDSCGVLWGFRGEAELREAGATHIAKTPADILALFTVNSAWQGDAHNCFYRADMQ
ncbi:MAG: HAD family hydrolase [Ruthenibacterium sp.]